jgi:hypothetical protein
MLKNFSIIRCNLLSRQNLNRHVVFDCLFRNNRLRQQVAQFLNCLNVIGHPRLHCWRDTQRLVNPAEVCNKRSAAHMRPSK